jgi:hypothetical protein
MDAADKDFTSFVNFERMIYATCLSMSAFVGSFAGILLAYVLVQGPPLDATLSMAIVPYSVSMTWVLVSVMRHRGEMKWKECLWSMLLSILPALLYHILFRLVLS